MQVHSPELQLGTPDESLRSCPSTVQLHPAHVQSIAAGSFRPSATRQTPTGAIPQAQQPATREKEHVVSLRISRHSGSFSAADGDTQEVPEQTEHCFFCAALFRWPPKRVNFRLRPRRLPLAGSTPAERCFHASAGLFTLSEASETGHYTESSHSCRPQSAFPRVLS